MKGECTIVFRKNLLPILLEKWTSLDITGAGATVVKHTKQNKAGTGKLKFLGKSFLLIVMYSSHKGGAPYSRTICV